MDELPDGAIEHCRVTVIGFVDPERDGGLSYDVTVTGDAVASTLVGLLEMAKHDVMTQNDEVE